MSKNLTRTYSFRKPIRPIVDYDDDDDDGQQRDSYGRKRVPVVDCLLDSSSSSSSSLSLNEVQTENQHSILWLTFNELCHIRYVLTRTEKQVIQSRNLCFRCGRKLHQFLFLPFISHFLINDICYICQQNICKKCTFSNFQLPSSKVTIPVRIQTLIKPTIINIQSKEIKSNAQAKTICLDCLQVFNECSTKSPVSINHFRRTLSLPPASSKKSNDMQYTRQRRRYLQMKTID